MVPRITSKGKSFKGAGAYFLHDLGKAETSERVDFTYTVNMLTNDPEKAIKVMAWTAEHAQDLKEISGQKMTGRKAENPVYNYCLAWAPDQDPTREEMIALGLRSMAALGAAKHEALFVAHSDTPHKHLHVILNRVDPETGLMAKMAHDKNLLSRLAQAYEEETGRVYCPQRVANNQRRDLGEQHVKAADVDRLAETPEYQARRAARLEAQREAGALALEKLRAERAKDTQGRDLRAAFDQAAGTDDRQYRAKDLERVPGDETAQARAAWQDELAKQRSADELVRQKAMADRRAEAWDAYETRRWQALNDRHTEQREALRTKHAEAEAAFEKALAKKYASNEVLIERQQDAAQALLHPKGFAGLTHRMSGRSAQAEERLSLLKRAAMDLRAQRDLEQQAFSDRLSAERETAQRKQAKEVDALAVTLRSTKARQDAALYDGQQPGHFVQRVGSTLRPHDPSPANATESVVVRGVGEQRRHNVRVLERDPPASNHQPVGPTKSRDLSAARLRLINEFRPKKTTAERTTSRVMKRGKLDRERE